jgi:hypothetical protein
MSFVFQFHHFAWNNLPLSFVIFLLFFLFGYYDRWLVKLTRVGSNFFFFEVVLLNFVFFCLVLLLNFFFFILISYRMLSVYRPSWLGFASSTLYFLNFFFIFDFRLLGLKLYDFFSLFFLRVVSVLYQISNALVNLTRYVSNYYRLNIIFLRWKNLDRPAA